MLGPLVVLVGETNPYGGDPWAALYDEPAYSAGGRLRRLVLGLPRQVYLGDDVARYNLCVGRWSASAARLEAARLLEAHPTPTVVLLGRKVATAFARATTTAPLAPFTRAGRLVAVPHPSGLCREWHSPEAVPRVRALLAEAVPGIPWGSA